jgi:hypothetical protein
LIYFPTKTEISLFFSAFRAFLGPTELSAPETEWRLVTLAKDGRGVKLNFHLNLVSMLRMTGVNLQHIL